MKRKTCDNLENGKSFKRAKFLKSTNFTNTPLEKRYLTLHGKKVAKQIKSQFPTAIIYNTRPLVIVIPNFMSAEECKQKLSEISPEFEAKCVDSTSTFSNKPGKAVDTSVRKSKSIDSVWPAFLDRTPFPSDEETKLIGQIPIFIRYQHQGFVRAHTDLNILKGAQRRYTALLYLNDVPEHNGGATEFHGIIEQETGKPLLIQPKCGDLVFFRVSMLHPYQDKVDIFDWSAIHRGCELARSN